MDYPEAINWLFATQKFGIKLGLEGPRRLLRESLAFPAAGVQVAHIAGTNGKGSTCAIMESVARTEGRKVGLFTSPHLIDYCERIRVNGVNIPQDECAKLLTELREICERLANHPSFFEITLAVAMRWFRAENCNLIILETGMGGRLDATTAIPADVCGITPIGMDHTQWLGDTIEKIAKEKAGIFVEGVPAVSSPQEPAAERMLKMEANERRTPLRFINTYLRGYTIGLAGRHQAWNAMLALECLYELGLRLTDDVVRYGLQNVNWPGRFEKREHAGHTLILDGAHNLPAARVLAATWREKYKDKKAHLIFGAVEGKDVAGVLAELAPIVGNVHLCPINSARGLAVDELEKRMPAPTNISIDTHQNFASAFKEACERPVDSPILISGSLFLVGEARAILENENFQSSLQ